MQTSEAPSERQASLKHNAGTAQATDIQQPRQQQEGMSCCSEAAAHASPGRDGWRGRAGAAACQSWDQAAPKSYATPMCGSQKCDGFVLLCKLALASQSESQHLPHYTTQAHKRTPGAHNVWHGPTPHDRKRSRGSQLCMW